MDFKAAGRREKIETTWNIDLHGKTTHTEEKWPVDAKYRYFWGLSEREYEQVREIESATQLSLLGIGTSRVVMEDGASAIKLPRWGRSAALGNGRLGNLIEGQASEYSVSSLLLPVEEYDSDGYWLRMPLAKRTGFEEPSADEIDSLTENGLPLERALNHDTTQDNFGWFDDSWRIMDYGRSQTDIFSVDNAKSFPENQLSQ